MAGLRYAMSGNFPAAQRGESVRRTGQVSGPQETGDTRRPEIAVFGLFIGFLGLWYLHIKKEENERKEERRIKNDGSRIFRLPVKKISGFLGSVMFLSCLAFPLPTFAEETLFTEEAASGNKKSEEKETLIYERPHIYGWR